MLVYWSETCRICYRQNPVNFLVRCWVPENAFVARLQGTKIQPMRMCVLLSTFQISSDHPAVPIAGPSLFSRCKLCQVWIEVLASSLLWNAAGSDLSKPGQCLGTPKKLFAWSVNSRDPNNMLWCWNRSEQQTLCRYSIHILITEVICGPYYIVFLIHVVCVRDDRCLACVRNRHLQQTLLCWNLFLSSQPVYFLLKTF